jgi:hypothetical protein
MSMALGGFCDGGHASTGFTNHTVSSGQFAAVNGGGHQILYGHDGERHRTGRTWNIPVPLIVMATFLAVVTIAGIIAWGRARLEAERTARLTVELQLEEEKHRAAEVQAAAERRERERTAELLAQEHELRLRSDELHEAERAHRERAEASQRAIAQAWADYEAAMRTAMERAAQALDAMEHGEAAKAFAALNEPFALDSVPSELRTEFLLARIDALQRILEYVFPDLDDSVINDVSRRLELASIPHEETM